MRHLSSWLRPVFGSLTLVAALAAPAFAQGSYSLAPPTVGQSNVADADPPVIRPTTKPCKVQLFTNLQSSTNVQPFNYAPPAGCAAPWAKVVFVGDFGVTGTNQFDRTAEIQLGNTTIYYGTTQEPSPTAQPTWHVESDLTDYTALFKTKQLGSFLLGNYIEGPYCCYQYASAYLEFYPANASNPAPTTADQVLPLPNAVGAQLLSNDTYSLSESFNLPRNVEKAYLDVFAQGQNEDEFWWSCIPNNALPILGAQYNCGNTAFRQAEIRVDGKLAGLAPVYPYIFTGGVDPDLWRPIPGPGTLNFKPYRVDLTPFAGQFSDGKAHTVALKIKNAANYFLADATLLVFQDPGSQQVTGGVTGSTLSLPPPANVHEQLGQYAANGSGSIQVTQAQSYKVTGYVNTSHGTVISAVESQLSFSNVQVYTALSETVTQLTKASETSITTENGVTLARSDAFTYPLTYDFSEAINADGSGSETIGVKLGRTENTRTSVDNVVVATSTLSDQVAPIDTLSFDASGNLTSEPVDTNTEKYLYKDTNGHCWSRTVSASNALVSAEADGKGCPGGENQWK